MRLTSGSAHEPDDVTAWRGVADDTGLLVRAAPGRGGRRRGAGRGQRAARQRGAGQCGRHRAQGVASWSRRTPNSTSCHKCHRGRPAADPTRIRRARFAAATPRHAPPRRGPLARRRALPGPRQQSLRITSRPGRDWGTSIGHSIAPSQVEIHTKEERDILKGNNCIGIFILKAASLITQGLLMFVNQKR